MQANVRRGDAGLAADARISLTNADMAALSGAVLRATGRLSLQVNAGATGLSPATLIGALSGTGTVSVEGAQFSGLDPAAIDAAVVAVDRGLPVDSPKVSDILTAALDAGKLNVQSVTGAINISSGRARITAQSPLAQGAEASANALIDVVEQKLDVRATLTGAQKTANGGRPEVSVVFRGPISAPRRSADLSAFVGWLTLRSVERETKRLEDIQSKNPAGVGSTTQPRDGAKAPDLPPPINIKPAVPQASKSTRQ
jgi:large subunit ribosomal protein L24